MKFLVNEKYKYNFFFVLGLHYILYKPLSKSLNQVPEKQQDPVTDNFAAKLNLYTCYYFIALVKEESFQGEFLSIGIPP